MRWGTAAATAATVLVVTGAAACGNGAASEPEPSVTAPTVAVAEPSGSVGSSPPVPASPEDEAAGRIEQRFREFVVVRDDFLVLPPTEITEESIPLDQVTVGALRRNLGRAGSLMPLYDERVVGFQGTTEVVRVEVVEVDLDPVVDERDGLSGIEGTAVVQACLDTSSIVPVGADGLEVVDAARDPDLAVSAFDVLLLTNGDDPRAPAGADWYLVEATEPVGEVPCP